MMTMNSAYSRQVSAAGVVLIAALMLSGSAQSQPSMEAVAVKGITPIGHLDIEGGGMVDVPRQNPRLRGCRHENGAPLWTLNRCNTQRGKMDSPYCHRQSALRYRGYDSS